MLRLAAVIVLAAPSLLPGSDIAFQAVEEEETQLGEIMQEWHDAELKRQGGEFRSHGWWPWGLRSFDFDSDGDLDLIASHHGTPGSVILKSHLRETGKLRFTNCTDDLGIDTRLLPGADDRPWIWDINGDGFLDIGGMSDESKAAVLINDGGKRFVPLEGFSFQPLAHPREISDLNGDGYLDVDGGYRGQWLYQPDASDKATFEWIKAPRFDHLQLLSAGLRQSLIERKQKKNNRFFRVVAMTHAILGYDTLGYSTRPIDLNADGIGDVVVQGSGGYGADYLGHYLIGSDDGSIADRTQEFGLPHRGAPIWVDDLTGDAYPEVLVAGAETGGVYVHNTRDGYVRQENALSTFLQKRGPYLLRAFRIDMDNDSDWDLVMSNPRLGRVELFENQGGGNFQSVLKATGWDSNPIVVADMNNDGLMDVAVGTRSKSRQTGISIFLNRTAQAGHFCRVRLKSKKPNPFAVGAVIEAFRPGASRPLLTEKAHWDGTPIHVGLNDSQRFELRVTFPDGKVLASKSVAADSTIIADAESAALQIVE